MMDPAERSINTRVIPQVTSATETSKDFASCVVVRDTVKKSKASHDHAMKAT